MVVNMLLRVPVSSVNSASEHCTMIATTRKLESLRPTSILTTMPLFERLGERIDSLYYKGRRRK